MVVVRKHAPSGWRFFKGIEKLFAELFHPRVGKADMRPVFEARSGDVVVNGALVEMGRAMPRALERPAVLQPFLPTFRGEFPPEVGHVGNSNRQMGALKRDLPIDFRRKRM
jgi:hypothetical protein